MTSIRVLLSGGPAALAEPDRLCEVTSLTDKVKVPHASGYEHFVHSGEEREIDGSAVPVFEWCDRTRVAE